MVDDEKKKFDAADLNKDGSLDGEEYVAFVYPYDFAHMHDVELERTLQEQDKDKDGIITKEEFIGDSMYYLGNLVQRYLLEWKIKGFLDIPFEP